MRAGPGVAFLVLLGGMIPFAVDGAAASGGSESSLVHASYDVRILEDGTWRNVVEADDVPEHWEWWSSPSSTLAADGQRVEAIAFHQAFWRPGANWTDRTVTHLASGKIVREDSTSFGPLPWMRSDLALNVGVTTLNYENAPVQSAQTVQQAKFDNGRLPCGHSLRLERETLVLEGSCTSWPNGNPEILHLPATGKATLGEASADLYGSDSVRAWLMEGLPVPGRLELGDVRLDLVGLRRDAAGTGHSTPSSMAIGPPPTVWKFAPLKPWGLDETGAELGFTAKEAYETALTASSPIPLSVFLLENPTARPFTVAGSSWQAGESLVERWDFVFADDDASWAGAVTRESEGARSQVIATGRSGTGSDFRGRQPGLPTLSQLPIELPTALSLLSRWSAWSGEPIVDATYWGYSVACLDPGCGTATARFEAGREQWHFPSQRIDPLADGEQAMQGTTNRATFALDGSAMELAESDWRTQRPPILGPDATPQQSSAAAPSPRLLGIQDGAKVVLGVAAVLGLLVAALRGLPVAVALYARIRTDALPEHPTRSTIIELVGISPGIRYSELLSTIGCGKGTLEHHLNLLEKGGHVVMIKSNGLATYFRTLQASEGHAMAWLRSTTARRILGLLAEHSIATAELHILAGCSRSTAHHHLVRIEAAGLALRAGGNADITDAGRKAWDAVRDNPQPT